MQKYQLVLFKICFVLLSGITKKGACVPLNQYWLLLTLINKLRQDQWLEALVPLKVKF